MQFNQFQLKPVIRHLSAERITEIAIYSERLTFKPCTGKLDHLQMKSLKEMEIFSYSAYAFMGKI